MTRMRHDETAFAAFGMPRPVLVMFVLLSGMTAALACKVPVFRYALERWESDPHRAMVFFDGELDAARQAAVDRLRRHPALTVESIDVGSLTDDQWFVYGDVPAAGSPPAMRLAFPRRTNREKPYWSGELTEANAAAVLDSPLRRRLVDSLLAGTSVCWVLLESGDAARDDEAFRRLLMLIAKVGNEMALPEGIVTGNEFAEGTTPLELDDVLRSTVPLKIAFEAFRLPVEAAAGGAGDGESEAVFRAMLEGLNAGLVEAFPGEPLAVPVYGRCRALEGIPLSKLTEEHFSAACQYLCGACSCQVKDENPGLDLLVSADWSRLDAESLYIHERALPPLIGVGDVGALAVRGAEPGPLAEAGAAGVSGVSGESGGDSTEEVAPGAEAGLPEAVRNTLILGGFVVVLAAGFTTMALRGGK